MNMLLAQAGQPVLTQIFGARGVAFIANAYDEPTSDPLLDLTADRYGGRDLISLRNGDKAIFRSEQLVVQRAHVDYLRRNGFSNFNSKDLVGVDVQDLPLSETVAQMSEEPLRAFKEHLGPVEVLLPYISNAHVQRVAEKLGLHTDGDGKASDFMNNKWETGEALRQRDVLVCPRVQLYRSADAEAAYKALQNVEIPGGGCASGVVYGKLSRSAAGRGVTSFVSLNSVRAWSEDSRVRAAFESSGLRQGGFLERGVLGTSVNLLMYVGHSFGDDLLIGGSRQLLAKNSPEDPEPTAHVGNLGPLPVELQEAAVPLLTQVAELARLKGAFGFHGVDVVVTADGLAYHIEDNYRLNGSSSSLMLATQLGVEAWAYTKFSVSASATVKDVEALLIREGLQAKADIQTSTLLMGGAVVINSALPHFGDLWMQVAVLAANETEVRNFVEKLKHLYDKAE